MQRPASAGVIQTHTGRYPDICICNRFVCICNLTDFLENTMKNCLATTLIATTALASSFATSAASTQNDSLKPVYSGQ
jgi:hypothetical protein